MIYQFLPIYLIVFLSTFLITAFGEHLLIPYLRGRADQPIYEDGPKWHASKGATPTMGGLAFLISSAIAFLGCALFFYTKRDYDYALSLIIYAFFCIGNSTVGLFDDLTKIRRGRNAGLTPKQKLIFQAIIALAFLFLRAKLSQGSTNIDLLFAEFNSPFFYYIISIFLILGIVNCANLTDGIDGLAASVAYAIGISYFLLSAHKNPICAILAATLIGASVAFLIFNINPAKIFMGDTGSLLLGALAISCAFSADRPLSIIPMGIIYVIEGFSVILQVAFFKLTKKRILKMAPIHHHLEKCGMTENKICVIAILVTLFCALIPLIIQ